MRQTVDQIADKVMTRLGAKLQIIAPVVRGRKGEYVKQLETYKRAGFVRVRVDGNRMHIEFNERQRAVTEGQYAVLYDERACLGGGVITDVKY